MNELSDRIFDFVIKTLKFLRSLPKNEETKVIRYQLIKSSTSTGANYEESQAGSSRADFGNKVRISLREVRESNYWLRMIAELSYTTVDYNTLNWLINESEELMKILGSISQKTR